MGTPEIDKRGHANVSRGEVVHPKLGPVLSLYFDRVQEVGGQEAMEQRVLRLQEQALERFAMRKREPIDWNAIKSEVKEVYKEVKGRKPA